MTTIDTSVKGTYRIENDRGELLAEVDNAITDLGMTLLASHPSPEYITWSDIVTYFSKGMLANIYIGVSPSGAGDNELAFNSDGNSQYASKIIPRSDGLLQINTTVKKRYVFSVTKTVTHLRTGYGVFSGTIGKYTTSQAALPSPGLTFQPNEAINISYTLQYVTNCNRKIENMPFTPSGSSAVNIPPNITVVRNSPIVTFPQTGLINGSSDSNSWGNTNSRFRACLDLPMYNQSVQPINISAVWHPKFNMYFYSDVDVYDQIKTTTPTMSLLQPAGAYDPASNTVKNYVYKKQVSSIKYTSSGNTWSTSLRFLFEQGEWPTTAKSFSLLFGEQAAVSPSTERANAGIFTALQTPYNPYRTNANMVVGIDYKFNWTRG